MTSQQILQSDFLDILFEKRNKLYGAYLLRRQYNVHLLQAMFATSLLVIALMFFGSPSSNREITTTPQEGYLLTPVDMPNEKPEPVKPQPPKAPAASAPVKTDIFNDQITPVEDPVDPLATQSDLQHTAIGSVKVDGSLLSGPIQPPPTPVIGGNGTGESKTEKADPPLPSRSPQFPGGTDAWVNFLNRHLRPPQDLEPGEKRISHIRFSVDEEGVVTNFQVVQSGGSEFDNEVIRVLKKMPKWLPALQNGKPIAVSFTQPVSFIAAEE